jgi:O-antigen/teichoic acid export membrane protein
MIDKAQEIKNSIIYLFPSLVGFLLPLLTLPIFTRILTPQDYGVLALAQVFASVASGIVSFGLIFGYEIYFFEYHKQDRDGELLYSTLAFVITAFIVMIVITFFLKESLSRWIINTYHWGNLIFFSFFSTGLGSIKLYYLTYFKNTGNAKSFFFYTIDETIIGVVLSLFFVIYMRVGVIGMVWGQVLASLTIFLILGFKFLNLHSLSFNWAPLKDSLKLSYPLTPRIFLGVIGNQFDKYMIGLINSVGGVGIYSIGQRVANIAFTFMTSVTNVFQPHVLKQMNDYGYNAGKSIGSYLLPFLYVCVFVCLIISLFAEEIIIILTPKAYHEGIDIVIIFSMLNGSYFFGKLPQLGYVKKTGMISLISLLTIILNFILIIPFIMKWGAIGAAWGTFLAGLISGSTAFVISQKYYEIKWEYKKIGTIFFIFFGSSIAMILLRNTFVGYEVRLMTKCMSLAFYLYLGMKLNILTRQNYSLVKNMIIPAKDGLRYSN